MIIYLTNLFLVTLFSIIAVRYSKIKYIKALDQKKRVPNLFFLSLIIYTFNEYLFIKVVCRYGFRNYYNLYFFYGEMNISNVIGTRDWGFYSIATIMYKILPDNFIAYNFLLAALTFIPIILTIRKYSVNFTFSIILYITMMMYYEGFNGVRQAIAVSLCFSAYPLLYNKKFISYSVVILIAYLFHSTALLMIPLMYLVTRKSWSKTINITLVILTLTVFALPNIWVYLIGFLELIGQEKMANDYSQFNYSDDGINVMRILVAMVPVILSLLFYKNLKNNNVNIDILINMSLFYLLFLLFGTQLTVLARISSYFGIFNILLIPELASIFKGRDKLIFKVITITLFFIYMLLLLPVDSNLLPYRFIFNRFE